ncbi:hypothetical protein PAEPH01_2819, partial [Pancytospora epiphaga]
MLLVIYPVVSICLFVISAIGLYRMIVKIGRTDVKTTFQNVLQIGMTCSISLHLLSMLVIIVSAYSIKHYNNIEIAATRYTLYFDYISQILFRAISILCLNIGILILSGMDPLDVTHSILEQASIYSYTVFHVIFGFVIYFVPNVELQSKVMLIETFLSSESIAAAVFFALISKKVWKKKRNLEASFITERFFVEPIFDTYSDASAVFACCFILDSLLRISAIMVSINPLSVLIVIIRDITNILRCINHALFLRAIVTFLFIDVQTEDVDLLHRVLLKFESLRRDGFSF